MISNLYCRSLAEAKEDGEDEDVGEGGHKKPSHTADGETIPEVPFRLVVEEEWHETQDGRKDGQEYRNCFCAEGSDVSIGPPPQGGCVRQKSPLRGGGWGALYSYT